MLQKTRELFAVRGPFEAEYAGKGGDGARGSRQEIFGGREYSDGLLGFLGEGYTNVRQRGRSGADVMLKRIGLWAKHPQVSWISFPVLAQMIRT